MLRTITELVPFGQEEHKRNISVMYLANLGSTASASSNLCNYFVGYYEKASVFSGGKDIRKFKYIGKYNRMNSTFHLMKEIYDVGGWLDNPELYGNIDWDCTIEVFDSRAKQDIGFIV